MKTETNNLVDISSKQLPEWQAYLAAKTLCAEAKQKYGELDKQVYDLDQDEKLPELQAAGEVYDTAIENQQRAFEAYAEATKLPELAEPLMKTELELPMAA